MKRAIVLLFLLLSNFSYGQWSNDDKRSNYWILGLGHMPPYVARTLFDFSTGSLSTSCMMSGLDFHTTDASICDVNGDLLFYTNGIFVADKFHTIMPNGDSLNPGYFYNIWSLPCCHPAYRIPQGALILPKPGSSNEYYIFHETIEPDTNTLVMDNVYKLLYTVVDMNLNNGRGDVVIGKKNVPIVFRDTLDLGCITAVRHGNGRDWWLIIPKLNRGCYHRILFTPNGVSDLGLQCIGKTNLRSSLGQAVFSPDGSKYARCGKALMNSPNHLEEFSFDRCTGYLSEYVDLSFADTNQFSGVSISPNSRYLYYSNERHVYQYDLQSQDIDSSKIEVAAWDGTYDTPYHLAPVLLGQQQQGPDGRVYLQGGMSNYYSTIESPDNAGLACNVQQHSVPLAGNINESIPNFPNFRLHNLPGSPCDTLVWMGGTTIAQKPKINIEAYPNPAQDIVNIKINKGKESISLSIEVYDMQGDKVIEVNPPGNQKNIALNVAELPPGIYLAIVKSSNKTLGQVKFEVVGR